MSVSLQARRHPPCRGCGAPASIGFSVIGRTIGQPERLRKMKCSRTILYCEGCSRSQLTVTAALTAAAGESLAAIRPDDLGGWCM